MVKNTTGGKKTKRGGNKYGGGTKSLQTANSDQSYARIDKKFGDGRFLLTSYYDGSQLNGKIKGSLRGRMWVDINDLVLVSERSCNSQEKDRVDIIFKYNADDERTLQKLGELKKLEKSDVTDTATIFTKEEENVTGVDDIDDDFIDFI